MYSARRTGAKTEMFGYVPGGYARILTAFEELLVRAGVSIRLGQPVRAVRRTCTGELRVEFGQGCLEDFSRVAVTTAAPLTADLCPTLLDEEKERLRGVKYQGLICASLLLKEPVSPFYITNIADAGIPFTAVIEMSALVDQSQFGGKSLVYLPKYLNPASPYFGMSFAQIREDFLKALELMYPSFRRPIVECFQISRVKYLLPVPTINYSAKVPPFFTSVPGLYVVNSAQIVNATLNVNETIRLAESAAQAIVDPAPVSDPVPALFPNELAPSHS
jgi:protoporphyrinogen oxidase